jgi:hypothetical protein
MTLRPYQQKALDGVRAAYAAGRRAVVGGVEVTDAVINRFVAKVDATGECWVWIGGKSSTGYGAFGLRHGQALGAHRVAWALAHGAETGGLFVCHRCDNRVCVRPAHLFLGTHEDNMRDMVEKGRKPKGDDSPSRRHIHSRPRGEEHGNAKLTDSQVRQIRDCYRGRGGPTMKELAEAFRVSKSNIFSIVKMLSRASA